MARYSIPVNILINGQLKTNIDSGLLVPGDVIEVPGRDSIMPCDAIVLTGSVIINEAMLTGESIPVIKSSLPIVSSEAYDSDLHAKNTLYSGTKVI
jgi:cation-transporting ATPase 13A3/4/5